MSSAYPPPGEKSIRRGGGDRWRGLRRFGSPCADADGPDRAATNGWIVGGFESDTSRFFRNPGDAAQPFAVASAEVRCNDPFYESEPIAADFDRDGDQNLLQLFMDSELRLLDNQTVVRTDRNYLVLKPR